MFYTEDRLGSNYVLAAFFVHFMQLSALQYENWTDYQCSIGPCLDTEDRNIRYTTSVLSTSLKIVYISVYGL